MSEQCPIIHPDSGKRCTGEAGHAGLHSRLPSDRFAPRCEDGHRWPDDYDSGDTCYCGAWYLITRDGVRIVQADNG